MIKRFLSCLGLVFLAVAGASGCEADNTNEVQCVAKDCLSACRATGHEKGACAADRCVCEQADTEPGAWRSDSDTIDDSDAGDETESEGAVRR